MTAAGPDQGAVVTVGAAKEVILSAGALKSPQILQLSGVGAEAELSEHGIPLVSDVGDWHQRRVRPRRWGLGDRSPKKPSTASRGARRWRGRVR